MCGGELLLIINASACSFYLIAGSFALCAVAASPVFGILVAAISGAIGILLGLEDTWLIGLFVSALYGMGSALSYEFVQSRQWLVAVINLACMHTMIGIVIGVGHISNTFSTWWERKAAVRRPAPVVVRQLADASQRSTEREPTGVSRVITLHLVTSVDPKKNRIAGTSIAGERVVSIRATKCQSVRALHEFVAEKLASHLDDVKLVLPDGRCLWKIPSHTSLASLIPGIKARSKRARQRQQCRNA